VIDRPRIQWQKSYVTADKTFRIYLAEDEAVIREHARFSGFPANVITEVKAVIDPATATSLRLALSSPTVAPRQPG
jgi:hypothetical protein